MIIQIIRGLLLAFYYVRGSIAWDSVVELTREVNYGWLLRVVHSNTASFVFVVLFVHFLRGLLQSSFYLIGPWLRGWVIMLLTIAAAFLGYVLPWGQMSFWGATVIINLLRVLPIGKILVIWLWGGFYVRVFTCSFFYAAHFLVPFVVIIVVMIHLVILHFSGSTTPSALSRAIKMKFMHLFLYKDGVNLILIWFIWIWALSSPDWRADPVNFVPSDLSRSPIHIQPEWYFLHLYAVLRSIPNKLGGLIGFVIAIIILRVLSLVESKQSLSRLVVFPTLIWWFISFNLVLIWLGSQPVEDPYIFIGQLITCLYFTRIITVLSYDSIVKLTYQWREFWIANLVVNSLLGCKFYNVALKKLNASPEGVISIFILLEKEMCFYTKVTVFLWSLARLVILLLGMGAVAFVTLMERKILGLTQLRLGPNKVTLLGLLQPMADGIKLLSKFNLRIKFSQFNLFVLSPLILITLFLLLWRWVVPWSGNLMLTKHSSLLYFSILGVGAYAIIITGWRSTRTFSKLGSIRGILQSLSYEVALIVVFVFFLLLIKRFNLFGSSVYSWEMFRSWITLWIILSLIESNRAPFDLVEGESELIRGFNIEIGSLIFVYLFLREYGMVIVIALITRIVIINKMRVLRVVLVFILLLMRSCFPRVRYDSLMRIMWQRVLPVRVFIVYIILYY